MFAITRSFLKFPSIPQIRSQRESTKLAEILKFKSFSIFFLEIWKALLKYVQWLLLNVRCNSTRISQSLLILVPCNPCCYLSSKKLYWLNFVQILQVTTLGNDKPAFYLLTILGFLKFPLLPRIHSAEWIRKVGVNF